MIKCALVAGQGARNEADNPESWLSVRTLALCDGIPYCQTVKLGLKSLNGRSGFETEHAECMWLHFLDVF